MRRRELWGKKRPIKKEKREDKKGRAIKKHDRSKESKNFKICMKKLRNQSKKKL